MFQIIFSIFVGSQGLLIFIFHGIRPKNVRKQWESWLEKHLHIKKKTQRQTYVSHSQNRFPTSNRSGAGHAYGTLETSTLPRDTLMRNPPSRGSALTSPTVDAIKTGSFTWQETNEAATASYEMKKEYNDTTQKSELGEDGNTAGSVHVTVHVNVVIENENAEGDEEEAVTQL